MAAQCKPFGRIPDSFEQLTHPGDWYSRPDGVLQSLADFANSAKLGMDVTLVVAGGMISGTIESAQDYFSTVSSVFRGSVALNRYEQANKLAANYAELFFDSAAKQVDDEVAKDQSVFDKGEIAPPRWPMARYIHLAEGYFTVPGQCFALGHVRLLLSQVIAWTSSRPVIASTPAIR